MTEIGCNSCGRPYSLGPDLVVSDENWAKIEPPQGGFLCPNCMNDAFEALGAPYGSIEAAFTSGPFANLNWKKPRTDEPAAQPSQGGAYRYSYSQSRMQPPFWIVKDGQRHMAEVWNEDDAQQIVVALDARSPKEPAAQPSEREAALVKAAQRLIKNDDEERRILEPSCQECTGWNTPNNHDKGPCDWHEFLAAVAAYDTPAKPDAGRCTCTLVGNSFDNPLDYETAKNCPVHGPDAGRP